MRIGVDVREVCAGKAGKGRYVTELIAALAEIDHKNEYILYGWHGNHLSEIPKRWEFKALPQSGLAWHLAVAGRLRKDGIDLYWATTSYIVSCITSVPTILVVHDLATFIVPEARLPLKTRILERLLLKRASQKSKAIVTLSESTKNDLIRVFQIPSFKITVTGEGVSNKIHSVDRHVENLPERFILFVGTIEPRKNIARLIHAYSTLESSIQKDYPLVIVGKRGWYWEDVDLAIKERNVQDRIVFLDYVPDEDLPAIYSRAACFVYPSLYEGFGLPPLEAMACGTPVITSNISSLPEVVGEAGILVDPYNIEEIAQAIRTVLTDPDLRRSMSEKGLERAKLFTWENTARQTIKIYEEVLQG